MKTSKEYLQIIHKPVLTYDELTGLIIYINQRAKRKEARKIVTIFNQQLKSKNGLKLTPPHFKKAYKYICKAHFNNKGKVNKTTPLNSPILVKIGSNLHTIKLIKLYQAGNIFKDFYTYQFKAISETGESFKYFIFNNQIQIAKNYV